MKLLIIGAGIGGLTTALACKTFNLEYEVFEAAPEIQEVGAGIWVPPNAMQVFDRLGIAHLIVAAGHPLQSISVGGPNGNLWYSLYTKDVVPKYRFGTIAIHRARLQSLLYQSVNKNKIHTGKRLIRIETDKHVTAYFDDGTTATGDCLIGADGIRSATRTQLFGELPLRYSGQTCWRGIVKNENLSGIDSSMRELWGKRPGQRFAYSRIGDDSIYYYATLAAPAGGRDQPEAVIRFLDENFGCFGRMPEAIIRAISPSTIIRTDLYDIKPFAPWTKETVALLGDAAHPTTPNLGQGAAQAIEDAYVLVSRLALQQPDVTAALAAYEKIRRAKAHYIVNTSWAFGQITNMRNPVGIRLRNWVIRSTPAFITDRQIRRIYSINF